jgi:anthranilate phosphoribosyltransferase
MIKEAIQTLAGNQSLTRETAGQVMQEIMDGQATPAQIGAFLIALAIKGESPDEIAGLAAVMRQKAIPVKTDGPLLDIVGTGGDGLNTFNISTASALIAAAAGLKVAKHGNRAASSRCGSADVLEKLGVKINLTAEQVTGCIEQTGIGFIFAAAFHPAMKQVAVPRKEIGIRTVFNILGPLTNPAGAEYMLLGVPGRKIAEKIVPALQMLPFKRVLVVTSLNGMDELSTASASSLWDIRDSQPSDSYDIQPEDFGLARCSLDDLRGASPEENAALIRRIFQGSRGPRRDIVLLNAGAALVVGGRAASIAEGLQLAAQIIDDGLALSKLEQLVEVSNSI